MPADLDPGPAADWLFARRAARPPFVGDMPAALRPDGLAAAYRIQAAVAERRAAGGHGPAVGWKVGSTTPGMQALLQVAHPCAGRIHARQVRAATARFERAAFCRPAVECEIAVTLARPLDGRGRPVGRADVAAAASSLHAAFEIVDDRYGDVAAAGAALMTADDFFHAACVVGPAVPAASLDPGTLAGRVELDGVLAASGAAAAVLGHPYESIVWLAACLAGQGQAIPAGSLIMTGSMTLPVWMEAGASAAMTIDGLGRVSARFD